MEKDSDSSKPQVKHGPNTVKKVKVAGKIAFRSEAKTHYLPLSNVGRHIVLVMDRRMSRIRGNNLVAMDTTANTAAASAESAQPPTGNPPHAPPVQPLYPKA